MTKNHAAVILAGGAGQRMGGVDKPLALLHGHPLITHVIETIMPQTDQIAIAGRTNPDAYRQFGLPILPDQQAYRGPISGILSAILWARLQNPTATHVLIAPGDTPFLPEDLLSRLVERNPKPSQVVIAASQSRAHYTIGLWPLAAEPLLRAALEQDSPPPLASIAEDLSMIEVVWRSQIGDDPFFNINTKEALELAELRLTLAPRTRRGAR